MNPKIRNLIMLVVLTLCVSCSGQAQPEVPAAGGSPTDVIVDIAPIDAPASSAPTAAPASDSPTAATASDAPVSVGQIADQLQSCSYDGKPVKFGIGGPAPSDCRDMVSVVMNFTGLPQNFDVMEADVPNAAAAILLDQDEIPHRVIGFNPMFIQEAKDATGGNEWAAVSIMAHEVGHHLSGHTIQPGGSQPLTELEADKFSGFVLYKMGASRDDALIAMKSLVPEGRDGPTHPGQGKRVAAITDGWEQACMQIGRADCENGQPGGPAPAGLAAPTAAAPAAPEATDAAPEVTAAAPEAPEEPAAPEATAAAPEAPEEPAAPEATVAAPEGNTNIDNLNATITALDATAVPEAAAPAPAPTGKIDVLPMPDPNAIPSKSTQFVYDETGLLDRPTVEKFEQQFFDHANQWGVEIVTMLVNDLHGLSADEYAAAMLRQMRIGKLDVGNGAVLVYEPKQQQFGLALGPGVMGEMKNYVDGYRKSAKNFFDIAYPFCVKQGGCNDAWTEAFFSAADHIRRDTDGMEWTIRYQNFADMYAAFLKTKEAGAPFDLATDPTARKIARLEGTVEQINVPTSERYVNQAKVDDGYIPVRVNGTGGEILMLYVLPSTMDLQPAGKIEAGKQYVFIAREAGLTQNLKDAQQFDLLSYDLMQ